MSEKANTEDSISDSNTPNKSFSELLLQDIYSFFDKNYVIITKDLQQKIPDILSYLKNNSNSAINKNIIVKFLQKLFTTIYMNSEIFSRHYSSDKDKLNLVHIIIQQYITYTNNANSQEDENNYREELLKLFEILMSQITIDRESYHYILSFLLKYINEKDNNFGQEEDFHSISENLAGILKLLKKFYNLDENQLSTNYLYFSGGEGSSITIQNKMSPKHNKKLLNTDENLCILLFLKVFPSEYIKTVCGEGDFTLLELKLNEKKICINIDKNNNLKGDFTTSTLGQLSVTETNWVLIKYKRKKNNKIKIYLNGKKQFYEKIKDKEKEKDEKKEIILFKNFIGICYNFMIFKTKKKKQIFPTFLEHEVKINNIGGEDSELINKTDYYNGFTNEQLLMPFIKTELKDELELNLLNSLFNDNNFSLINRDAIKEFAEILIAIYMPTRVIIPEKCNNNTLLNSPQLILQDTINGLDAEFRTDNPILNGVHIYKRMTDDFGPIGGLNNILPIIEIMAKCTELLTKKNLDNFLDLFVSIFNVNYKEALLKDNKSNFFMYLSYFLEKIPDIYFDNQFIDVFETVSSFLINQINENYDYFEYVQQFYNYILLNEKILFKFHHEEQSKIIQLISNEIEKIKNDKKKITIDIVYIIKIILRLDENKTKLFCCKNHSEYFTENLGIMEPELTLRLKPIEDLLIKLVKDFKEKVINRDSNVKKAGQNLYNLYRLLTYDISPCVQKMIINIFSLFCDDNFLKYYNELDQETKILNISLFVFKNSIFDVKQYILDFIFIILKNKVIKEANKEQLTDIEHIISKNILPFFLFVDKELLEITKIDNQSDTVIQDYCYQEENKILNDENDNKQQDIYDALYLEDDSNEKAKGIKVNTIINNVKYSLPLLDKHMSKIHSIYNRAKLKTLIKGLFEVTYKYFNEGVSIRLCLNMLIKLVAKGDLLLIFSFLEKLQAELKTIESNENKSKDKNQKLEEIYNNQNLLQWLIETCFQAILIEKAKLDTSVFVPGFDLDVEEDKDGNKKKLDDKEKLGIIKNIIQMSKSLLKKIFEKNIYIMDYIFTWSKYYYELRNETNNFNSIRELIFEFMEIIGFNNVKDCKDPDIMNDHEQKMYIYFWNLLFEFVTFYKLKQEDLEDYQRDSSIYKELSRNLKYILISKMDDSRQSLRPIDAQAKLVDTIENYQLIRISFAFLTPLWKGNNKQDNEICNLCIGSRKNININELELLLYNFSDIKQFNDEKMKDIYVNKGIPLIYILYHFFTLVFSIGGEESELRELFFDCRLFFVLLIISSSTLSISGGIVKKKKFPTEEQYKNAQQTIEVILFNYIYFLFNKIKETTAKINGLKERVNESDSDSSDQKYLNYLVQINELLIENLGFFLKPLNKIYREIKSEEEKKSGVVGTIVKGIRSLFIEHERVKKSGVYKFIEKMYLECPNLGTNPKNLLDELNEIDFDEMLENVKSQIKDKTKLETIILSIVEDSQITNFFEKYSKEYKKCLFPFISYISTRKDAIKNIIPIYDVRPNITSYPKDLCLIPDYVPEKDCDLALLKCIKYVNERMTKDLELDQKKCKIDDELKIYNYKKEKEKLFVFTRIWSNKEFFYNKEKYRLKYKLVDHISDDLTRVLLTPITDMNYYLPYFSKFDPINLFRNTTQYKSIYKAVDLSFDLKTPPPPEVNEKKRKKEKKVIKDTPDTPTETNIKANETPLEEKNKIEESNESKEDEIKNALYYLGQENFKFINEKEEKNNENIFIEYIKKKHSLDKTDIYSEACLIKLAYHIRGIIFHNKDGIGFYSFESERKGDEEDYDVDRKVCFGSVFRSQDVKYNFYYVNIPYNKIQFVFKRRYYFKRTAFEIFTEERKSYFFRITDDTKIKPFYENIKNYMKNNIEDIFIEFNKFDDKIGFYNKNNIFLFSNKQLLATEKKCMNLKTLYEKWYKWEMPTLRMLMLLNIYSNRSYNDINQYPVFPWIITDYKSEKLPPYDTKNFVRPMGKPMGMLDFTEESKERKENYEEHWKSNEAEEDKDENYDRYGSHYSTCLYLTYYLVRVFPYSFIRIELQGKKFDDPNRLFNSLSNSFECALTQKSDLREIIPEFFCLPEMFMNMNELNLGEIFDSKGVPQLVGGVEMPLWANSDQYIFIGKHRELLESSEVNEKINEWFNIIFGSKQKGKEAKKICNLFFKQTYEDYDETFAKMEKSDRIFQCRMVEFGVTPNQIFKSDTYKRQNINDVARVKRNLLFNILQKKNKKAERSGKEFDLEEIKVNIEDNISKMFIFLVKKKDKKKDRIYLLTNNKVKIYTKYEKNQFFKGKQKEKQAKDDYNKTESDSKDVNDEETSEEMPTLKDITENPNESISSTTLEKQKDEIKLQGKEISKINVSSKYDKKFNLPKYRMKYTESPTLLFDEGFHIVFGGFWNGIIIVKQLIENFNDLKKLRNKKTIVVKTGENSPITKIIIDRTETYSICCNLEGTVFVYIIDPNDQLNWNLHKKINEGQGEISSIALNEVLSIFIVCFKNGYCMVYTFPNCNLINSFRIGEKDFNNNQLINQENKESITEMETNIYYPDITFISSSPLPCYVFYIKKRKSLCVYSINAHFIKEAFLGYDITENGIKKYTDHYFRDHLFIYNSIKNAIDVHRLIDLELVITSPEIDNQFVDFQFTKDLDYAFILTKVKQKTEDKSSLIHKLLLLKQGQGDGKNPHFIFN